MDRPVAPDELAAGPAMDRMAAGPQAVELAAESVPPVALPVAARLPEVRFSARRILESARAVCA